jgi:hypothetical protein
MEYEMKIAAFTIGALLASTSAMAGVWNLADPTGVLGTSHVYSDGVAGDPTITAFAEGPGSPQLTAKNDGPDEVGLGLTNDPSGDHEITPGSWVALDITQLVGRTSNMDMSFAGNSTAGGDIWHVYGSNSASVLGTSILSGTGDAVVELMGVIGIWSFVNISADAGPTGNGTVLANEVDANVVAAPVREPSSLSLLAMAAAGFALVFLGRRGGGARVGV